MTHRNINREDIEILLKHSDVFNLAKISIMLSPTLLRIIASILYLNKNGIKATFSNIINTMYQLYGTRITGPHLNLHLRRLRKSGVLKYDEEKGQCIKI